MKLKLQHPILVSYLRQLKLPGVPTNPPDMTLVQVAMLEELIDKDPAPPAGVRRELNALKRMMGGRGVKSFDRLALKDYVTNPEAWTKFLTGPATQLGMNKPSAQAQFWLGASEEVRAAILKSATALKDPICPT